MKQQFQIRQGDVLLEAVDEIPTTAIRTNPAAGKPRLILAFSDAVKRPHTLPAGVAECWETEQERFINLKCFTSLEHEEHPPIPLAPGRYRVVAP